MDPRHDLSPEIEREIESARSLGTASAPRETPRAPYASSIELDYGNEIVRIVDAALMTLAPLENALPALLDQSTPAAAATVREYTRRAYVTLGNAITNPFLEGLARRVANRLVEWERATFRRQLKAALGVDIPSVGTSTSVARLVGAFVLENVSQIKSVAEDLIDQIEKDIVREMADRSARRDAAASRKPRTGKAIVEARAKKAHTKGRFIARDQVGKTGGRAAAAMQQEAGIREFQWISRRDPRVRPLHRKLDNGRTFRYPRGHAREGLPGEPPGCRCFPLPMFDGGVVLNIGKRPVPNPPKRTKKAENPRALTTVAPKSPAAPGERIPRRPRAR